MSHSVEILRSAQKSLAKIQGEDRERVIGAIRMLGKVPKPKGVRKLSGRPAWRIRVGNYRVLYEIHDQRLVVLVVAVGPRRDIYRSNR